MKGGSNAVFSSSTAITFYTKQEITPEEDLGTEILNYCKKYKGTDKYNVAMLAMEFGYQLALKEEPKQEITLEEDLLNTAIQVVGDNNITTIKEFLVKHKWQQERMV